MDVSQGLSVVGEREKVVTCGATVTRDTKGHRREFSCETVQRFTKPSLHPSSLHARTRYLHGASIFTMIRCPHCGSVRLIPLSFPVHQREAGPDPLRRRPVVKCCSCGERVLARVVARVSLPS
jgi:DNA-directed RNA polymerase subunit RPC12/RpoP